MIEAFGLGVVYVALAILFGIMSHDDDNNHRNGD